jgi:hypothetical protein
MHAEEGFMDETLLGLMEIVGPIILLVLLIWVVLRARRRGEPPQDVTERATRDAYREEEEMRREGNDDR